MPFKRWTMQIGRFQNFQTWKFQQLKFVVKCSDSYLGGGFFPTHLKKIWSSKWVKIFPQIFGVKIEKKWKASPSYMRTWGHPLKFVAYDSNIHTALKLPGWWNPTCVDTSCTTMYIVYIPTSSKGCCLNPKEWCIGTPHLYSAPFGRSRYIYICIYVHQNKYAELQYEIYANIPNASDLTFHHQTFWICVPNKHLTIYPLPLESNHFHLRNDHTLDLPPRIQSSPPGWHHIFSRESQAKPLFATEMLGKGDNPNHTSGKIGL